MSILFVCLFACLVCWKTITYSGLEYACRPIQHNFYAVNLYSQILVKVGDSYVDNHWGRKLSLITGNFSRQCIMMPAILRKSYLSFVHSCFQKTMELHNWASLLTKFSNAFVYWRVKLVKWTVACIDFWNLSSSVYKWWVSIADCKLLIQNLLRIILDWRCRTHYNWILHAVANLKLHRLRVKTKHCKLKHFFYGLT